MPHWEINQITCPRCGALAEIEEWGQRSETRIVYYIEKTPEGTFYVDAEDIDGDGEYDLEGYYCGACSMCIATSDQELGELLERSGVISVNRINKVQEIK